MAALANLVPMRWLCGPLDISQHAKQEGFTARSKQVFERWLDPSLLGILRGTPINCVVVNWAAGLPADEEQQKALVPLISQGKAAGLSFVGIVDGEADRRAALNGAMAAGLAAVMTSGESAGTGLPVIRLAERMHLPWGSSSPVLAARGNTWPGIASAGLASQGWRTGLEAEVAGPTADPWIDSNGWFLRLAKVYAPSKKIWLLFEPPRDLNLVPWSSYERALSDVGAHGGRWVLTLDETLRAGLAQKDVRALDTWRTITRTLAFFESRHEWLNFESLGVVGVISDFSGPNEMIGTETLNLLARRNLPFRILEASKVDGGKLNGLKAVIYIDEALPPAAVRQSLLSFVRQGGVLLASERWKDQGGTASGLPHPRLDIRTLGRGKFALCKDSSPDPYMVARDIHVLLGRAHDLVRFFNISAFIGQYSAAPDGFVALLQITNFATRVVGDLVTVWFSEPYRSARLWTANSPSPATLSMYPENSGIDVELPSISTYARVEISKGNLA